MKKNLYILFTFISLFSRASTIPVDPYNLAATFELSVNGDTLLLADGTYAQTIPFPADKIIILKADENANPIISFQYDLSDAAISNGGLIFDGITFNRGGDYFFRGNIGNVKILKFKDCEILNVGRCFLRTDNADGYSIDSLVFDGCLIHDCGTNGWNFIYSKHSVKSLVVKNSTLYNYENGESFFFANAMDEANDFSCIFLNNTIYKWAKSSDRALCNTGNRYSANSTFTFKNNIINKPGVEGQAPKVVNAVSGLLLAENNLLVDYNGGYGTFFETINDLSLESLGLESIGFPDPDHGDFSITSTSPLAKAGAEGGPIGDPRWIKTLSRAVHIETAAYPVHAGYVIPVAGDFEEGDSITITATAHYSYRFKEWKNKNGVVISTENPLSHKLTQDQILTAVFDSVDTYALTLAIEGSEWGKISMSPAPVNGIYETGTLVTLSVVPNDVSTFLYWDDFSGEMKRQVLMDENKSIKATFDQLSFIVGWDFNLGGERSNRSGDYFSKTDNTGLLNLFNYDNSNTSWGASTRTFGGISYDCARRYTNYSEIETAPRYFVAKFSATGYDSIQIKSSIAADNYCVHTIQKMQYSTNGTQYFDLKDIDMTGMLNAQWIACDAILPDSLMEEQKSTIYIRWIPDLTSPLLGTPNSNETEGFYLANVCVFANEFVVPDNNPPQLLSTVPSEGSATASANGRIVLNFDEKVKAGRGEVQLNGKALSPAIGSKTISFQYTDLVYGADNSVYIPNNAITDLSGNSYEGTTIHFKTMDRPKPIKRLFDAVIALDGTGDFTSVQSMVDAMPENRTSPWLVFIKNGFYHELVRIPSNKSFLHLIGQNKDSVIITFTINCASSPADSGWEFTKGNFNQSQCAAMVVESENFYAENISFENEYGVKYKNGPQALAISTQDDKFAFYNCRLRSFQDTWQTNGSHGNNDRFYIYKSFIEGAVDYIYGAGNLFCEENTLYNLRSGSVIVAPNHSEGTLYGYVFSNCVIDGNKQAANGKQKLGRPWHESPIAVYLNTTMKIPIAPEGWTNMGAYPGLFAEYNSHDINGNPLDLTNRKSSYTVDNITKEGFQTVITAEEAIKYTYENVIGGSDNWNPRAYFESAGQPQDLHLTSNGSLCWNDNDFAICYVVIKNDEVIGFSTESCYTDEMAILDGSDKYEIKSVNEFGSISQSTEIIATRAYVREYFQPKVFCSFGKIVVQNIIPGQDVQVFTIDGRMLTSMHAESAILQIDVQAKKGVHIVKIGEYSTKIIL